ncbi:MAG: type II toxin-antitoxin system RelB/DinJ family antitoxin [Flavobacteriales bacterium]|nr:type II toxin-antitoxin system RelB/DinJ family antitoxin [Flavobacteriales bacterium]
MRSTDIKIRTDAALEAKAQKTLSELGLDMTTAINIFLTQVVQQQAIPFRMNNTHQKGIQFGGWQNKIKIHPGFDEPLDEFKEYV